MRYKEDRNRLLIEPTTPMEEAYLEEVFGLRKEGDACQIVRKNASGLRCWAYAEMKPGIRQSTPIELLTGRSADGMPPGERFAVEALLAKFRESYEFMTQHLDKTALQVREMLDETVVCTQAAALASLLEVADAS